MIDGKLSCRLVVTALVLAAVSGCRQPGSLGGLHLPWSTTAHLPQTPSPPAADVPQPLRPEQKAELHIVMARTLERQGRTDEAKKAFAAAIESAPQLADGYHFLALLYDRNGECRAAEKYYLQALERNAENAELHCDLGYSYYLQQRWQEAQTEFCRALELSPDLRRAHNNFGLLLARTGREDAAFQEFMHAGASPAEAHANLAYVFTLTERWPEAETEFQQALRMDPNSRTAQEGLTRVRSLAAKRGAGGPWDATQASYQEPARR